MVHQALQQAVPSLTDMTSISCINYTHMGWVVMLTDNTIWDLLMTDKSWAAIYTILEAVDISLIQQWCNYTVLGVTSSYQIIGGACMDTASLVSGKAKTQTRKEPVSCWLSWYGLNLTTGWMTWVVSFLKLVEEFTLFNNSEQSRLIMKRAPFSHYNPGC